MVSGGYKSIVCRPSEQHRCVISDLYEVVFHDKDMITSLFLGLTPIFFTGGNFCHSLLQGQVHSLLTMGSFFFFQCEIYTAATCSSYPCGLYLHNSLIVWTEFPCNNRE